MKKLFENKLFHYTFVLTMVAIACGLAIGIANAITAPIIEENRLRAQLAAYQEVMPEMDAFEELSTAGDPATIISKVAAKDAENTLIGYIYVVAGTNVHGNMRMVVSISPEGIILGAVFSEINQTLLVNATRENLQRYIGSSISNLVADGDIISGVTDSLDTVKALLSDIATAHAAINATSRDTGVQTRDEISEVTS
ncbi:MAG: hypothetical protein EA375_01825 [Acholeplasmataceae bacterium]|nr:MAG: hypothetical protein EA375_01825 [Acholeplasmataceae bacterium]